MAQQLFLADETSINMFMLESKDERLNYIESICCVETKNKLIKQYELFWGCHENDHVRNYFSFLNIMSIEETLKLYDKLSNKLRSDMIYAIGFDHKHLHEMIAVHSYLSDCEILD